MGLVAPLLRLAVVLRAAVLAVRALAVLRGCPAEPLRRAAFHAAVLAALGRRHHAVDAVLIPFGLLATAHP
eukprot:9489552-Pyramimonas_sp.AAC.1